MVFFHVRSDFDFFGDDHDRVHELVVGHRLGGADDRRVVRARELDGQLGHRLFGYPRISVQQLIRWTAEWVRSGGASLGKPTHFEARDGRY